MNIHAHTHMHTYINMYAYTHACTFKHILNILTLKNNLSAYIKGPSFENGKAGFGTTSYH